MKRAQILMTLLALSLTSCGFWNPDPAERLAYSLEHNAKHLSESGRSTTSFDFVPDAERARTSPRFDGDIAIRIIPGEANDPDGLSTITVSEWFATTYHSRFVRVTEAMEVKKRPNEPFRIVLKKSEGSIYWTELK